MRVGTIYMHSDNAGRAYIGRTWNEHARFRKNGTFAVRYPRIRSDLTKAMRSKKFVTTEICRIETPDSVADDPILIMLEVMAIEFFHTIHPYGYNGTRGGGDGGSAWLGRRHTAATKRKMSRTRRRENIPKDRLARMRIAVKGRLRNAKGHFIPMPERC